MNISWSAKVIYYVVTYSILKVYFLNLTDSIKMLQTEDVLKLSTVTHLNTCDDFQNRKIQKERIEILHLFKLIYTFFFNNNKGVSKFTYKSK